MSDDYRDDTTTTGSVEVGGTATGEIETGNDFDWFAVDLVAGTTYVINIEGFDSGGGTLDSTVLRGLYDKEGVRIAGTQTAKGGVGDDACLTFTATESGTHYIAARGYGKATGTYTVQVVATASDGTRAGAHDLGDITDLSGARFPKAYLDGDGDRVDYFKFTLTEAKKVGLGLRRQDADADLVLEDAEGKVVASSTESGTAKEWISQTLAAGTYFVRVEAQETGANEFLLRYGVREPDPNSAPAFGSASYGFDLAENADGGTDPVALGTVAASDPEGATVTYSIAAGNDAGLFEIDGSTGALSYKGPGEDYETGPTSYELTVRASDGALHNDAAVTVNITDVQGDEDLDLPADSTTSGQLVVGEMTAGEIEAGGDVDWFALELEADQSVVVRVTGFDPVTRYYVGGIQDPQIKGIYNAQGELLPDSSTPDPYAWQFFGPDSRILGFQTSGGGQWKEARLQFEADDAGTYYVAIGGLRSGQTGTYTVAVSDGPSGDDFTDDTGTSGQVAVGGSVEGSIEWEDDVDWFAVDLTADVRYELDLTGTGGPREFPVFGDYIWDSNPHPYARWNGDSTYTDEDNAIDHGFFTPKASGTYYIPVEGGSYDSFWHGNSTGADYWDEPLPYTLSVAEVPETVVPDVAAVPEGDVAADTSTTGSVDVDGSAVYSAIDFEGDVDWYAVDLEADKQYAFVMSGDFWGTDPLAVGEVVGLYDSDGNRIANSSSEEQSNGGIAAVATWQPETGGKYFVAVAAAVEQHTGATGDYRLAVSELPDDDMSDDAQTSGSLAVGGSSTGTIEMFGDVDWLAVDLEAGRTYKFEVDWHDTAPVVPSSMEDLFDAETGLPLRQYGSFVVEGLYDAQGDRVVAEGDSVTYTPSEAGTFYVAVEGGTWNPIGDYEVTAEVI